MTTTRWLIGLAAIIGAVACGSGDVRVNRDTALTGGRGEDDEGDQTGGRTGSGGSGQSEAGTTGSPAGGESPGTSGSPGESAGAGGIEGTAGQPMVVAGQGGEAQGVAGAAGVPSGGAGGAAGAIPANAGEGGILGSAGEGPSGAGSGGQAGSPTPGGSAGAAGDSSSGGTSPTGGAGGSPATGGAGGEPGEAGCHANRDCPEGQVCAVYGVDGFYHCTSAPAAGAPLGDPCTASPNYTEYTDACEDHLCSGFSSQCTRLCIDDADCGPGDGFLCMDWGTERMCMQACAVDADCASEQVCSVLFNETVNRFDWVCSNPRGEVSTGEVPEGGNCASGGDCESGFCLTFTHDETVSYYCTGPCETADDCPAELATCGTVNMTKPDSSVQVVNACVPSTP